LVPHSPPKKKYLREIMTNLGAICKPDGVFMLAFDIFMFHFNAIFVFTLNHIFELFWGV
jgi:hypothetical protein